MFVTMKQKIAAAFAGYLLIGTASGLFVYSGLGADCFNSFVKGVAPWLHLAVGTSSYVVQVVMLAAVLLLGGRKQAGPGTVLGSLVVMVIVNLFGSVFAPFLLTMPLAGRVAMVLLAAPLSGFGLALIQCSGLGSTANDILPILFSERLPKLQFRTVRVLYDCTELLAGMALGILPGFTTLCAALLIGPSIQASMWLLKRPMRMKHKKLANRLH